MSRTLTAQDRASLIKLASSLPSGSPERKAILAGLKNGVRESTQDRRDRERREEIMRRQREADRRSQQERERRLPSIERSIKIQQEAERARDAEWARQKALEEARNTPSRNNYYTPSRERDRNDSGRDYEIPHRRPDWNRGFHLDD
jgi:hypothetical protein